MDSVTCSLAGVVTDIELNRTLPHLGINPVRIVTHTHDLDDSILEGPFFASPRSNCEGKDMQWLTSDDRLAVAHRLQQYECTQQNAYCDPPTDRSSAFKHGLLLSAFFQRAAESSAQRKAGPERPEKS